MDIQNRTATITAESYLPDVVSAYPATRAVFDRYGLQGCGGRLGPSEQVGWFARLHGVAIDKLLAELNESASGSSPVAAEFSPSIADTIYRPFFLAGIATVLTLGCVWGAINLFTIGIKRHQLFVGAGAWTRYGLRFRRLFYHGICLPGCAQV